jgi:large repetitive protein
MFKKIGLAVMIVMTLAVTGYGQVAPPAQPSNFTASLSGSTITLVPLAPSLNVTKTTPNGNTIAIAIALDNTADTFQLIRTFNGNTVSENIFPSSNNVFSQSGLADGTYAFTVYAFDALGNTSNVSATSSIIIDTTAPDPATVSVSKTSSTSNDIALTITLDDSANTFRLVRTFNDTTVSDTIFTSPNVSLTQSDLADGRYDFVVYAIDAFGNTSNVSATSSIIIDTTPPNTPSITATKHSPNDNAIALAWDVPETTNTFRLEQSYNGETYTLVSDTLTSANTTLNQTNLQEGLYTYRISAIDSFGNISQSGYLKTLTVYAPNTSAGGYQFNPGFPYGLGANPSLSSYDAKGVLIESATPDNLGCESATNAAKLAGNIAFVYRGNCLFGTKAWHAQEAGAIAVVVINNIPGNLMNMAPGTQGSLVTIPVVMISDIHGAALRTGLDSGELYLSLGSIIIDTTPPATPSINITKSLPNGNNASATVSLDDTTYDFMLVYTLNGDFLSDDRRNPADNIIDYSNIPDGRYTVTVYAFDEFGNTSNVSATASVIIDTAAPDAPSLNVTKTAPNGNTIAIDIALDNTADTFQLIRTFNGNTVSENMFPSSNNVLSQSGLADGTYAFTVYAIDALGNTSNPSPTTAVIIDTAAPDAPSLFSAIAAGNSISLSWTNPPSDFDSVMIRVSTGKYPLINTGTLVTENTASTTKSLSGLTFNTTYKFSIFAIDAVGNVSEATHTSAYTQLRVSDLPYHPQIDSFEITIDEDVTTPIVSPQIGVNGTASVNIKKSYSSSGGEIGVNPGSSGTLTLSDPTSGWTDTGDVIIGRNGTGTVLQSNGTVSVTGKIILGKEAGSSGNYTMSGGRLTVGTLQISNAGSGSFNWTGGTVRTQFVVGNLANNGGTLDVISDVPITIAGNYSQNAASVLNVTLKGSGSGLSQLSYRQTRLTSTVTSLVTTTGSFDAGDGTLTIELDNFNPVPNTVVTVFSSPPSGTFATVNLPDLDSRLTWDQSQLYSAGILTVVGSSSDLLASRPLNAPNPFKLSDGSMLGYYLNTAADIELRVYRSSGNEVFRTTFIKDVHEGAKAGYNRVILSRNMFGQDLSAGIYPYLLISEGNVVGKGKFAVNPE